MTDANSLYAADSNVIAQVAGGLSPEERREAHRYGKISLNCTLADLAIDVIFLGVIAFVFAGPIDAWLAGFASLSAPQSMLRLLALFVVESQDCSEVAVRIFVALLLQRDDA